ncbi:hypothetical protein KCU84_g1702, partial [Aureobasidium melanogenum]
MPPKLNTSSDNNRSYSLKDDPRTSHLLLISFRHNYASFGRKTSRAGDRTLATYSLKRTAPAILSAGSSECAQRRCRALAALNQNNGSGQHTAFQIHPPKNQRGWLTNAFEAYDSYAYRDKHLDSLFAALFAHHHPKFLDADEDDELGISLTLQAVRDKALSHFCRAQYGDDKTLVHDPLTVEWGHHHRYYLFAPAESSADNQFHGQDQSSQA